MNKVASKRSESRLVSLDMGNYALKSFDGRAVASIRSLQTPIAAGQRSLKGLAHSPLIELDGQRWHVGVQCRKYSSTEATVTGDKAHLAELHLAALIPESGTYRLIASHHSPEMYQPFLNSVLVGHHSYIRNGVPIEVDVTSVEVIHEGLGTYYTARLSGWAPKRGLTIVIDLGGSTWLSTLYASDGEIIDHDAHERQGTFALAAAIAKDSRLVEPLQQRYSVSSPDPVVVQEGFAKGHYYGDSGQCWAEWLPEYLDPWWKKIIQTLKSRYQSHLPNVVRFLVTGGGSNLVTNKLSSSRSLIVVPDAEIASVKGAYLMAKAPAYAA